LPARVSRPRAHPARTAPAASEGTGRVTSRKAARGVAAGRVASYGWSPEWVLCHEHRRSTRRYATVLEMKEALRVRRSGRRSQATASGCGQKPRS
jgi:hypothetical protein